MSYILFLTPLAFILTAFVITCYKRYQEIQRIKKSLIYFRKARKYFIEENREIKESNNLEPGNDFYHDEHGNIIYGEKYIGAQRTPETSKGIVFNTFKKLYFSVDKKIRIKTINKLKKEIKNVYYLSTLVDILEEYENSLCKNFQMFDYNVQNYVKKIVGDACQLSFFNEIIYYMYIVMAQHRLKYVLCDFGKKFFN
jgi:hypothetical protein